MSVDPLNGGGGAICGSNLSLSIIIIIIVINAYGGATDAKNCCGHSAAAPRRKAKMSPSFP